MWWCDRRSLILGALALAGCGFQPVYGPGGSAGALRDSIAVQAPDTTAEFDLVARLETRLGRPAVPRYNLGYKLVTREVGVAITPDQETIRRDITGTLDFTLTEIASGKVVTSGTLKAFTGYSNTGSTVSILTASQDASRRLAVILADNLIARLQVTASDWQ